jgi:uroporphyrinogen decarboxylase
VSPALYRKFFKQPMARIFQAVKRAAPQARIFLHSCGSVRLLIPDFIETGVDILSAIQPLAKDMNSAELKQEFRRALVFHGGIDLQRALTGTLAEAIRETKRRIADYAPGGGYVAGPSNHFTSDVPVENFFALYRTAREFGAYPLPAERAK